MTADQNAPKPGDLFQADYRNGDESVEARFVDDDGAVCYRYVVQQEVGNGYMCSAEDFAAHFRPVPDPAITEPFTLWRFADGERWWPSDGGSFSGSRPVVVITIMPDGTWFEAQPPHKSQSEPS